MASSDPLGPACRERPAEKRPTLSRSPQRHLENPVNPALIVDIVGVVLDAIHLRNDVVEHDLGGRVRHVPLLGQAICDAPDGQSSTSWLDLYVHSKLLPEVSLVQRDHEIAALAASDSGPTPWPSHL